MTRRGLTTAVLVLGALLARPAHAQCLMGSTDCDPAAIDMWLRWGPTVSAIAALQPRAGERLGVTPVVRVGMFAGLPFQVETSFSPGSSSSRPLLAAAGVRLLPVSFSPGRGLTYGGQPGHNVGAIAGIATVGWYAGFAYEWLFVPQAGLVAEVQWAFGTILRAPPSFHLGAKFQVPAFDFY